MTGKSCLDTMFCLQQIITQQKEKNKETHLVFVEMVKAYDMVHTNLLWSVIRKIGIPQEIVVVIQ
jgi:hypothetical protein